SSLAFVATTLVGQKKFTEAEPLARECLSIRGPKLPQDWRTFNIQSILGRSLLGQGKRSQAEPLLLSGATGLEARQRDIPAQYKFLLTSAIQGVFDLYDASGRPESAMIGRQKLGGNASVQTGKPGAARVPPAASGADATEIRRLARPPLRSHSEIM